MTASFVRPDGRWQHALRQSWLNELDICAQRALLTHKSDTRVETDAACVGTAVHAAIETCIGADLNEDDTLYVFRTTFDELSQDENFQYVKYTPEGALRFGDACTAHWWRDVRETLDPNADLEYTFRVPLLDDDERVVELTGTMDYLTWDGIKDWKTSGGMPYVPWEKRRWAIQPTVYAYAAHTLELIDADLATADGVPFEYVVMSKDGVQRIEVHRTVEDFAWLRIKALAAARLIEADLPEWIPNDNSALCSAKWCPHWSVCKGAAYSSEVPESWTS